MATTAAELAKLVSTAAGCVKAAEDGDKAEAQRAVDVLKQLAKSDVSIDLLKQTGAGKTVNKMAKSSVQEVAKAADAVVAAWKESVKKQHGSAASKLNSESAPAASGSVKQEPITKQPSLTRASSGPTPASEAAQAIDISSIKGFPPNFSEPIRKNACKMFAEGLAMAVAETNVSLEDPAMVVTAIAIEIEAAVFQTNGGVTNEYKAKVKQLMFNLRDPNNKDLRGDVLQGDIEPDVLITLGPEELASKDRQAENAKIRDHMAAESVRGQSQAASTDAFK
jgi:transcription elongation factor S-II